MLTLQGALATHLALVLLDITASTHAFSTCHSFDLDDYKSKRIEAVRGQILSKLRIHKPPETDKSPAPEEVPQEVMLLYNSTQEVLSPEQACDRESSEEDYYAKEVQRIDMLPPPTDSNVINGGHQSLYFRILGFDVSHVDQNSSTLVKAEFRIYRIPNPLARAVEQRIEIYQLLKSHDRTGPSERYIDSRTVRPRDKGSWLSVDVTETVKEWLSHKDRNLGLKLSVHCSCCTFVPSTDNSVPNKSEELEARFAGIDDDAAKVPRKPGTVKGQIEFSTKTPHLILTLLPTDRLENPKKNRKKRAAAETPACSGADQGCCLRSLYIDFRRDLNWKWIHEPKGYKANFCAGNCPYLWSADNHYNMILPLYNKLNPEASASPCCVPQELEPLTIMYFVGRTPRVEQLSNMVVKSCKCR